MVNSLINDECNKTTNGKIPKIVETDDVKFSPITSINTVYFIDKFEIAFKIYGTSESFYTDCTRQTILSKTKLMKKTGVYYQYAQYKGKDVVLVPYKNSHLQLVLVKQRENENEAMVSPDDLNDIKEQFSRKKLNLHLPPFKMEFGANIKEDLEALGLNAFDFRTANFQKMILGRFEIHKIFQISFISTSIVN